MWQLPWGLSFDLNVFALAGLVVAIVVDLSIRYAAFERLESGAIDVALFTTLFSVVELVKASEEEHRLWLVRSAVGITCLMLLVTSHLAFHRRLAKQITSTLRVLGSTAQEAGEDGQRRALEYLADLAGYAVLVTFVGRSRYQRANDFIRGGKRLMRLELVQYIEVVAPSAAGSVSEDSFMLPKWTRRAGLMMFFLLGAVSLLAPFGTFATGR